MTDECLGGERRGDPLWRAIRRLPAGEGGIVFRHYGWDDTRRRALCRRVMAVARARHLTLVVAGLPLPGGGRHLQSRELAGMKRGKPAIGRFCTAATHDGRQLQAAAWLGADLVFLSPLHETGSHPGEPALGRLRFGRLARQARVPVIALGGMTPSRFRHAPGADGFAAISWWTDGRSPRAAAPASRECRPATPVP